MLIFENKDLPGLSQFLGERPIEYCHAANRGLIGRQSTLRRGGLLYTSR